MITVEKIDKEILRVGNNLLIPYDEFYLYILDLAEAEATRLTKYQATAVKDFLQQWINKDDMDKVSD